MSTNQRAILTYVITCDRGFAPNPFGGFLTLATCKPQIRRAGRVNDILVATGSVREACGRKLVYAAEVTEVVPLDRYGREARFTIKRPSGRGEWWRRHGDNIYVRVSGKWNQRENPHHGRDEMGHDLSGENALVCNRFWYFGDSAKVIPAEFQSVIHNGRGHGRIDDELLVDGFVNWLDSMREGCRGDPAHSLAPTTRGSCAVGKGGC